MADIFQIISNILPWILFAMLLYFTLVVFSYGFGLTRAKSKDKSLVLCVSTKGKIVAILEIIIYVATLIGSIVIFINNYKLNNNLTTAISSFNFLTIYTLAFALHIQDIIFVGRKNILIGNNLFEYRRIKKVNYPKKNKLNFIYGQKEYNISLFFTDITELKKKLQKTR